MLAASQNAVDTYRRIEFDARVEGTDGTGLTRLCLERAIAELGRADAAHRQQDRHRMAEALAKSSAAICALIGGIAPNNPLAGALHQLYGSADGAVRASITAYKQDVIDRVRGDLQDILALL